MRADQTYEVRLDEQTYELDLDDWTEIFSSRRSGGTRVWTATYRHDETGIYLVTRRIHGTQTGMTTYVRDVGYVDYTGIKPDVDDIREVLVRAKEHDEDPFEYDDVDHAAEQVALSIKEARAHAVSEAVPAKDAPVIDGTVHHRHDDRTVRHAVDCAAEGVGFDVSDATRTEIYGAASNIGDRTYSITSSRVAEMEFRVPDEYEDEHEVLADLADDDR